MNPMMTQARRQTRFSFHSACPERAWLRRAGKLMLAAALAMPVAAVHAEDAGNDAWQLLKKVQQAARQVDYAGVFTWQQGASLQSSRIVHIVDGTGERERVEVLDGAAREFIRHNDVVQCLVPEKNLILVEEQRIQRFPSLMLSQGSDIDQQYEVSQGISGQRVAGRTCTLIDIRPKDASRYGHRLCVDEQTDLLLKAQTLDEYGQVIDQIAFTSVQFGDAVHAEQLTPAWDTTTWKIVETAGEDINVADLGWRIHPPPGFRYVAQMARPTRGGQQVMHLVLTDGLAAISVFIEPVSEQPGGHPVQTKTAGAMSIHGSRVGDHWLTMVGEVPMGTLKTLAEQVEYVPPAGSSK